LAHTLFAKASGAKGGQCFQPVLDSPGLPLQPVASNYVLNGNAVTLNVPWTAYTLVAQADDIHVYRNGQLLGSTPYKKDTQGDFFIGRHWWPNGSAYSTRLIASLEDLRFYHRALSALEVQQLYAQVQTTPPAGSFESWALINRLTGAHAALDGDPERDGLTNWDEFCFGTSPTTADASFIDSTFAAGTLTLTWLERLGVASLLRESQTLAMAWSVSTALPVPAPDQTGVPAGYRRMQVAIAVPQLGAPAASRFFRVEAAKVP
jgi:hypothetical protein